MNETRANFKNQSTQKSKRPRGALPRTTEANPKEQCQAITLRSGREIEKSVDKEEPPMAVP